MTRIDLDELVLPDAPDQEGHVIAFSGTEFAIPHRMPGEFVVEVSRFAKESSSRIEAERAGAVVALADALASVFGAEQWQALLALRPTQDHIMALVNAISNLYTEQAVGNSHGSAGSSPNIRPLRKRTSNGSTESTSAEPAAE